MTALTLSQETQGHLAALDASVRRLRPLGIGWTTETAIKRARQELRDLETTIRQVRKGLPK